ncbi:hypothetical protein P3T20_005068 [Paraburkholderia sp. GAS206C]
MERYATGDATPCGCNSRLNLRPIGKMNQACQRGSAQRSDWRLATARLSTDPWAFLMNASYPQRHRRLKTVRDRLVTVNADFS